MGIFIAQKVIKLMLKNKMDISQNKVGIFGITFKENCPDTRNTKVIDIINELKDFGINPIVCDPLSDVKKVEEEYSIRLKPEKDMMKLNIAIFAVAHETFKNYNIQKVQSMFSEKDTKILIDLKSIFGDRQFNDILYWSL